MRSMLEIASQAILASSAGGLAALFHDGIGRGLYRAGCFLCNMHHRPINGIPGTGPGIGTPFGGGPDDDGKKDDKNKCQSEQRDLLAAQGNLDMLQQQINSVKGQINALSGPMNALLATMSSLTDACQGEVLGYLFTQLLAALESGLMLHINVGSGGTTLSQVGSSLGDPTGMGDNPSITAVGQFISDMHNYYTLVAGSWNDLGKMADQQGMTAISQFVATMKQLQGLIEQGHALINQVNHMEDDMPGKKKAVDDAQAALDACMAASG